MQPFKESYYKTGNYAGYLQRRFDALAKNLIDELGLDSDDRVIDFGCGYGGLVASLAVLGLRNVVGTDISAWAIEYGKDRFPELDGCIQHYNREMLRWKKDVLLLLDVLEHMPEYEIENVLKLTMESSPPRLVVARIPITETEGEPFVLAVSNNDPTHITCHTKAWWKNLFERHGLTLKTALSGPSIYDSEAVLAWVLEPNQSK